MLLTLRVLYPGTEIIGTTTPLSLVRGHFSAIVPVGASVDASLHHSRKTASRFVFDRGARNPHMSIRVLSH